MVKRRRNPDDKLKHIEEEVDRLIKERESAEETKEEYIKPEPRPESLTEKLEAFPKILRNSENEFLKCQENRKTVFRNMLGKVQGTFPSHPTIPEPKTEKRRIFMKTGFPRPRIVKPVAVILVIAMILTSIQLLSFISTGETVIVPSDFGIPEEFENAKQEFEAESIKVKQKAEGLLNDVSWSVEEIPERDTIYDKTSVIKEKHRWPRIFEDIENAGITPESSYKSWTHTTTDDFNINCSLSENVVISNDMIKLETSAVQGMFISNPLDADFDSAVLKDVSWHPTEQPGMSQIVIIVEVSDTGAEGSWIPVESSADVIPEWFKTLFEQQFGVPLMELRPGTHGRYFRYTIGFYGAVNKPQLDDITISVATATLDRKYYVFTYYNDILQVDRDGVAGGKILGLGLTFPEYNGIDVDGGGDDLIVSLVLSGMLNDDDLLSPPTSLIGGLGIEIYKINDVAPLTIYFVKPISYESKTYIWIIGFYFSSLPEQFSFSAISENITVQAAAFIMGGETPVDVQPPYEITWSMESQIPEFGLSVGYANFGPVNATHYFEAKFSPGVSNGYLYYEEIAEKLSLNWTGSSETDVSAYYREENLYVELELEDLPTVVNLSIESGQPCSTLNYEASSVLSAFSYTSYDFGSGSITHVNISNIPQNINLIGTFKIPPKEEPNPDPSDSFIGRALNYVIAKIGTTMNRIRKALTSITEIVSTPDNIFHLISNGTISKIEFWSLKGMVENNNISCELLNLSGNYIGMLNSSIQAGLKNVTELDLSFGRNITLMLKRSGAREPLEALYASGNTKISAKVSELPSETLIEGRMEELNYSFSQPVELDILARTLDYNMEVTVKNITSGRFVKKSQNLSLNFDQPVELECAVGKGQLYKMTGNYFFANTSEKTASLRLENLKSLYAGEQVGLALSEEYPLKIMLETNITSGKILIKNLPRIFNVSLPSSPISLPEMGNVTIATMPDLLSSVTDTLNRAMENISKITKNGTVGEKLEFSYESVSPPIVIVNLSSGENHLPWHHGITLNKSDFTLDMKVYLELPEKASFVFDRGNGLGLRYKFENWTPSFNWVSVSLEIGNKNIFSLVNITGLENAEGAIRVVEEEQVPPPGEVTPPIIGELNLSIELFLTSIPQNLNLTMIRGSNTSLSWNASSPINGIYLNIIREDKGNLYPSHLIVRNTPLKADFKITSASKAALFQVPEINVNAPDKLNFSLKLDAGLVGGKGDFLLYAEQLEYFSLKGDGNTVTINSAVDKLLFRMSNISLGGMKEIEILSMGLKSLRLTINFVFGKLPMLDVNCDAKETQINLLPSLSTPFGEKNSIALTDLSFFSLNTRKNSIRITDTRTHYITVAPVLSLWM